MLSVCANPTVEENQMVWPIIKHITFLVKRTVMFLAQIGEKKTKI